MPTALAAVVYSIGVPAFFLYLVFKFKERGQRGDKTVQNALGWLYEPFRAGEESWLGWEALRVLILTSLVGFLGRDCHMKVLAAEMIAFGFLVMFLAKHPYRRASHHNLQALSMCVPIVSLMWASAGG